MKRTAIITVVAGLGLFGSGVGAAFAQTSHEGMDHGPTNAGEMSVTSQSYMDAMTRMNKAMEGMKMTGKSGADFATMMIPHHQSAIDMAEVYLASDEKDPELIKLLNEIIQAQESEIAFLKAWLEKNAR